MFNSKGIIFAADIPEKSKLLSTINLVSPYVKAIKVGNLILYEHGWKIINEIKKVSNLPIIADLKIMDVPFIAEYISKYALNNDVDGITICGPVGDSTILACKEIFKEKYVFLFTEFTHCDSLITEEMAVLYSELAISLNCNGIQIPASNPNRIQSLRKKTRKDFIIISCGVGAQGPKIGSAIAAGANYEIIGRAIYDQTISKMPVEKAAFLAQQQITQANNF